MKKTRTIKDQSDLRAAVKALEAIESFPFRVSIEPGKENRSAQQNRLMHQWFKDAEKQGDQTAQEYRAYCKLHFGVLILRGENEEFRAQYDEVIRPLSYEQKIRIMELPVDFPVTRLMTVKQHSAFLNAVHDHFVALGFQLTDPSMLGIDSYEVR